MEGDGAIPSTLVEGVSYDPKLKLNTKLSLILPSNIQWLLHDMGAPHASSPLFTVIVKVSYKLLTMMCFIKVPNILRLTSTSYIIIFNSIVYNCASLLLLISLPICLPSLIRQDIFAVLFPKSDCHYYLEFEGDFRIFWILYFSGLVSKTNIIMIFYHICVVSDVDFFPLIVLYYFVLIT